MRIQLYSIGSIVNDNLKYAVIGAFYHHQWIYVRNKERHTWEMPGGRREENEDIDKTASRELFEETGALEYIIEPICDYSVTVEERTTYGRLYYAEIHKLGPLPESEIAEIKLFFQMPDDQTYAQIQPHLHREVLHFCKEKKSD